MPNGWTICNPTWYHGKKFRSLESNSIKLENFSQSQHQSEGPLYLIYFLLKLSAILYILQLPKYLVTRVEGELNMVTIGIPEKMAGMHEAGVSSWISKYHWDWHWLCVPTNKHTYHVAGIPTALCWRDYASLAHPKPMISRSPGYRNLQWRGNVQFAAP